MKRPDYSTALEVLKRDKFLAPFIKQYGPPDMRWGKRGIVFESLLRSIIYQQLSGYAAAAIHTRVLALFPSNKPTPKALLKIKTPQLRKAGLSMQKIAYVRDLAHKCLDGTIDEKKFPKMTSAEIIEHLTAVHGVGEWTAHMVLIFTLHRPDILPVGDLGIRKGFQAVYTLKKMPGKKEMEELAENWKEYASIASWYLWRVADGAKPIKRVGKV